MNAISGVLALVMYAGSADDPVAAGAVDVAAIALPAPGALARVGGDLEAHVSRKGEGDKVTFAATGVLTIDTPLPEGYPDPTPPGAIDLKRYPTVRRAEVSGAVKNLSNGGSEGFWPLFRHIQRRDIAMTSPVEMEYRTVHPEATAAEVPRRDDQAAKDERATKGVRAKETWTMAFLYRRAEQGDAGADASDPRVKVVDTPQMLVVSVGMKGDYSRTLIEAGEKTLDAWLATQTRFEKAGEGRALYYHGPSMRPWRKWAEVQYPVREIGAPLPDDARVVEP